MNYEAMAKDYREYINKLDKNSIKQEFTDLQEQLAYYYKRKNMSKSQEIKDGLEDLVDFTIWQISLVNEIMNK